VATTISSDADTEPLSAHRFIVARRSPRPVPVTPPAAIEGLDGCA
jgi:hypothetical protein